MQETWVRYLWEDTLEKETATHSSILVWEIPWAEELGWLQLTYVVSTEMMQRLSEAGMLAEQPCSCAHSSPGWPALRGLHRRLAGWLRALGTACFLVSRSYI